MSIADALCLKGGDASASSGKDGKGKGKDGKGGDGKVPRDRRFTPPLVDVLVCCTSAGFPRYFCAESSLGAQRKLAPTRLEWAK